jgi:SAM-dependent methyltransferase
VIGWDHPATAERYERFCRRHSRYRRANDVLVREAAIVPGLRVLDVGAGTGRTASAVLPRLGCAGSVVCVEPAAAMRAVGCQRLRDSRVTWRADLPALSTPGRRFDRVLAGAVIWQLGSFDEWIPRLASLLGSGGALVFDVPALYLGEPDEPGGGDDPMLLDLITRLMSENTSSHRRAPPPHLSAWPCRSQDVDAALSRCGLRYRVWEFRHRLTQAAYARWLSIPVAGEPLFAGVDPEERDRRLERALAAVDNGSFKWERWRGWTAWKS